MTGITRRLFLCALLSALLTGNAPAWAKGDGGGEGSGGEGSGGDGDGDGGGEGSGGEGSGGDGGGGEGSGGDGGGEGSGGDGGGGEGHDGGDDGGEGHEGEDHGPDHEDSAPGMEGDDASPSTEKEDHERVRGARVRGEIKSFDEVYSSVRDKVKGDIIAVEVETRKGEIVYEMTVLGDDGRVMDVTVDARTSNITAVRER